MISEEKKLIRFNSLIIRREIWKWSPPTMVRAVGRNSDCYLQVSSMPFSLYLVAVIEPEPRVSLFSGQILIK